jgi:hypothetical protein
VAYPPINLDDSTPMSRFMLDRQVLVPPGYAERSCLLVQYRLPLLKHCFVLCHEPSADAQAHHGETEGALLAFFLQQAQQLAREAVGDPQAFMLIHSGSSIRRRAGWHLHVFVVQRRWQKAWVYTVLGGKNFALACAAPFLMVCRRTAMRRGRGAADRA